MASKTENAKRIEQATERMIVAARRLSGHSGANADALSVTHKQAEMQEVLRSEAMADFLEQVAEANDRRAEQEAAAKKAAKTRPVTGSAPAPSRESLRPAKAKK
jgi:hypothetical protein